MTVHISSSKTTIFVINKENFLTFVFFGAFKILFGTFIFCRFLQFAHDEGCGPLVTMLALMALHTAFAIQIAIATLSCI